MSEIRVAIAANHPGLIHEINTALGKDEYFQVVTAEPAREFASKKNQVSPDIILLDPSSVKENAFARYLRAIQIKYPAAKITYILTEPLNDERLISDIKAGIRGYIKSSDPPAVMIKALRGVFQGGLWAERRILEKAIIKPMLMPETLLAHTNGLPPLTSREMEMLNLVLEGASNREIADRSSISERTVKTHLYRVYRKLNVKSRTKAIALLSHS